MADFVNQFQSTLKSWDSKFASNGLLTHFEKNTKLPRSYAILAGGVAYFFLIFLNVGGVGQLLSNIAGFVIPGYYSLLALNTASSKDDTELLTYWVVFAFLNVVEFWSKAILYWIPFYWFLKTVFLLYLSSPQTGGATVVYNAVIKPISEQYIVGSSFAEKVDDVAAGIKTD